VTNYNRHGSPSEPFSATNSRGYYTLRNFGLEPKSESTYVCNGCGREFCAFDLPFYSLATEGDRLFARNKARATAHAARCKGTQPADLKNPQ
jgi:hypothetical protein